MPKVTFVQSDGSAMQVEADDGTTLMRAAVENAVEGILATCGGSLSCGTCHLYVDDAWQDRVGAPNEDEEVLLEFVAGRQPNSRLSCQVAIDGALDGLVVRVPEEQSDAS